MTAALAAPGAATASPIKTSISAPGHYLKIGSTWTANVAVNYHGAPAAGKFRYEMIGLGFLKGKVEYKSKQRTFKNGSFSQVFSTPNSAQENLAAKLKIPFVLRFLITTPHGSTQANYAVFISK